MKYRSRQSKRICRACTLSRIKRYNTHLCMLYRYTIKGPPQFLAPETAVEVRSMRNAPKA